MRLARTPQHLIAVITISVIGVLMLTILLLYQTSMEQQRLRLIQLAQSNARMIEAIALHELSDPGHEHDDTLEQVAHAHSKMRNFGESGEFVLARRSGENIEYLLSGPYPTAGKPRTTPLATHIGRPMHQALSGESGTRVGLDYAGNKVLAAYEPIAHLNWGLVAKINMAEIRAPYLHAALFSTLAAVVIILLGSWLILRLTSKITRQLREAKERHQSLFELSPIGLALCTMEGKLVEANPAFAEIIGRSPEEVVALSYWDITPAKYEKEERQQLAQLTETGHYGPYEKEYIHSDGFLVPVRLSGKIVEHQGERFIWSSVEDISDRVCAEKRLRQAATVFDTTDEGIVITDENNRIVMVNSAFSKITGYSEGEALGHNPNMLRSGRHSDSFYDGLWQQINTEGGWRGEMWNRRKNGEVFPVWQQITRTTDDSGRLTNYVSTFSDISELKEVEHQLAHLAHHDELTGLPNRLYFKDQLEKALHAAKRHHYTMALLYLDLDGFKQINDRYGHDAGDKLLKEVAQRIKQGIREEDTIARLGGDEFIILLQQIHHPGDAALVAAHIVDAVGLPVELEGQSVTPSTSIGISIYPNDAESAAGLQKAADRAMYQAKEQGKNSYKFFAL